MESKNKNNNTSKVTISTAGRESGVPIYETNCSPIDYAKHTMEIIKEPLDGVDGAFLLHNVLTPEECQQFIDTTEKMGYEDALITTGMNSMVLMKDVRDNKRVMWQTKKDVWAPIWERIKDYVPNKCSLRNRTWTPCGLNERFRFYKYEPGQVFQKHYDGAYPRTDLSEMSHMTFIIYLNGSFDDGHTTFFVKKGEVKVRPEAGKALVFYHGSSSLSPLHEGSACAKGMKYVLRSDLMCTRDK